MIFYNLTILIGAKLMYIQPINENNQNFKALQSIRTSWFLRNNYPQETKAIVEHIKGLDKYKEFCEKFDVIIDIGVRQAQRLNTLADMFAEPGIYYIKAGKECKNKFEKLLRYLKIIFMGNSFIIDNYGVGNHCTFNSLIEKLSENEKCFSTGINYQMERAINKLNSKS